ncbi:DUF4097 family beta strand repeat protein [Streptomyces actinomycinicus]|uniref:DUF4097 family beta strand repeat protein n=1 Tax=Streptomyces actinomycinicus TaxID=1695166 RepID=A0A937EEB5_9ACTN|nr:DUF4097 family beta strand repeat-containing protein [Streptomyces actinomycinicus]MBL1080549.1 DUF4097 family beta strand repeat protein [Streptomyces actinomycinicus]
MKQFDTPAPVAAVLDIPAGRIQLIAADRGDTTVEVRPANAAKSRDIKAVEEIEVAYGDGVLHIKAAEAKNRLLGNSGSVEVTVQLPAGSRVEAKAGAAEFRGVGRLGDVVFAGGYRSVKIDEAASARLAAHDGDVSVGRLCGPAEISTQRGDIRIDEALRGTMTLRTQQGDIAVDAAPGTSASLDAHTAYGRIHNSLKNTGDAGLTIHATTSHGDITARSL